MGNKRKINNTVLVLLVLGLTIALSGCGKKKAEKYGQEISDYTTTEVEEILKNPSSFEGKTVTIEGEIVRECMTGCWFDVEGKKGLIYVDVKPSGFAIPQKVGKEVVVEGNVSLRDGQLTLVGKGVEIK